MNHPHGQELDSANFVSGIQKKKATVLRKETEDLVRRFGIDAIVTYTLTLKDFLDRDESERRWHSLHANIFRAEFDCGIHVVERAPTTGRLHWHGTTVLKSHEDVRTGFDFEAYDAWCLESKKGLRANRGTKKSLMRKVARNVTPGLRRCWKILSIPKLSKYGFGQAHVVPIKKNAEAYATYQAKYLSKPMSAKALEYAAQDKGRRSYRIWGKPRVCSIHHTPVTRQSEKWRRRVKFAGKVIGELVNGYAWDHDEFQKHMGRRWCFYLKPWISGIPIKYIECRDVASFEDLARIPDGRVDWKAPWYVAGRNCERNITMEFMSWYSKESFKR